MNWNEWLSMVGHITLPELRCEVPPTQELLGMIDSVGLQQWQTYCTRLERERVQPTLRTQSIGALKCVS